MRTITAHEALFDTPSIHFTMTTHVHGGRLDLESATSRLLRADLATSAAWPSEAGVRLPPGMKSLAKEFARGRRLLDDYQAVLEDESAWSSLRFSLRHPVVVGKSILFGSGGSADEATEGPAVSSMRDALNEASEAIDAAQAVSATERALDERLFGGRSRERDEFVRLILRSSYHDLEIPGSDESFHAVFEPRLLLHRSGVVQLTIAVNVPVAMRTTQLIKLARSDRAATIRSSVPEALLAGLPLEKVTGYWSDRRDAGMRLREMAFEDPLTLAETLERHMEAIGVVIRARLPTEWNTYATVIASAGRCCRRGQRWRSAHKTDIARLSTRYVSTSPVNAESLLGDDLSVAADSLLFANLGSATRIELDDGAPGPFDQLDTVLIIEHALLQYFRLRKLEWSVVDVETGGKALENLLSESIDVFIDMRQHEVRYGSARVISRRLLEDLGGEEMRRTIQGALNIRAQADAAANATAQARRSIRLTWIATLLAILVAIPTIEVLLDSVASVPQESALGTFLFPLKLAAATGAWGPWLVILAVGSAVILAWLLGLLRLNRASWRLPRRRGGWYASSTVRASDENANRDVDHAARG